MNRYKSESSGCLAKTLYVPVKRKSTNPFKDSNNDIQTKPSNLTTFYVSKDQPSGDVFKDFNKIYTKNAKLKNCKNEFYTPHRYENTISQKRSLPHISNLKYNAVQKKKSPDTLKLRKFENTLATQYNGDPHEKSNNQNFEMFNKIKPDLLVSELKHIMIKNNERQMVDNDVSHLNDIKDVESMMNYFRNISPFQGNSQNLLDVIGENPNKVQNPDQ